MFKVKIGEDEYEVTFEHYIPAEADYKSVEMGLLPEHQFRIRFGTTCNIWENEHLVMTIPAQLSVHDHFNRNIGRKVSLARALQYIQPENRVLFWQAYYEARGGKW